MIGYLRRHLHPFGHPCDIGGLFGGGGGGGSTVVSAAAPDYSQMAAASEKAAQLGKELGEAQIAEAKRQYDQNMEVAKPIIAAQTGIMNQSITQGSDYYDYLKNTYRPLEQRMVAQADVPAKQMEDEYADRAIADARRGQAQAQNQLIRQGLRYGWSPQRLAQLGGANASANATAQAQAAQGGRLQGNNLNWARKMDAAGLGRGLSGASTGAYGMANNAGNSAVANQMQPGNSYMAGLSAGTGTQMQGMGQYVGGMGGILNSQTSAYNSALGYNSAMNQMNNQSGGIGQIIGMGLGGWASGGFKPF